MGNIKTTVSGIKFDSKKESKRWVDLRLLQDAGIISDLRRQVPFVLVGPVVLGGRKKSAIRYFADFTYLEKGELVVEDCKAPHTRTNSTYRLKKHLMMSVFGIEIRET